MGKNTKFNKDFIKTGVFAFFVSLVLLFTVFELKKFQTEEEVKETQNRVLNLDPGTLNRVSYKDYQILKDKDKSTWRMVSPKTDYLNYPAVEDWLSKALSCDGRLLSDQDETVRWADFGFTDTSPKLKYHFGKTTVSLSLSNKEAFDGSVYLRFQRNKEPDLLYSSTKDWKEVFSKQPEDFRSLKALDWNVPEPIATIQKIKIEKKGKEKISFFKKEKKWKSTNKPSWSLDSVKVEAFLSDAQAYLHKGFADGKMRLASPELTFFVEDAKKNGFSLNLYKKKKKVYAVASYRPEHVLKMDKEALVDFLPEDYEFRDFSDLIGPFSVDGVKALKIRKGDKSQVFRFKDGLWRKTDLQKTPKGFEFNGAKVFTFLEKFKKLQFKRYVPETEVIFKSAKKKLYFYKNQKDIELTFTVGQSHPCKTSSKGRKNCILIATNKVHRHYGVALKSELDALLKMNFLQKASKLEQNKKPLKNKEQAS